MVLGLFISFVILALILALKFHLFTEETREQFLGRIEKLTEGRREWLGGEENVCRIHFSFEGKNFIFEDREIKGLKEKIQKVYLKAPIAFPLTIRFVEKRKKDTIRTTMVIASEIPDYVENLKTMIVPESLNDFDIYTNDIERAQKLFSDKKALRVFEKYKNMTLHGAPLMSLSFIEGMIILEFQALVVMNPNLPTLKKDIHILENYIDHLLVLIAALEK